MRILFLDYHFPLEAGCAQFHLLEEYAKNPEFQIDFVTSSDDGQHHLLKMGENITIHRLRAGKTLSDFAKISYDFSKKLAEQNSYDFIHAFSLFPCGIVARKLGKKLKVPYVTTFREEDIAVLAKKDGILNKINAFKAGKALTDSLFLICETQKLKDLMLGLDLKKEVTIIPNGVDALKYFTDASKRNPETFTIVCVSDVTPLQGVRFLIQAFKILSGRYDNARLVIVGDGNEKQSLEDLVQGLDLKDKVEFTGKIAEDDIVAHCQKSNLFVRPTLENSKVEIVLQAFAVGLPVITTKTEGIQEILEDGVNGLFVKMKDANDLVEKIEKLVLDQKACETMSKNARISAERLAWDVIAGKYFALYVEAKNLGKMRIVD